MKKFSIVLPIYGNEKNLPVTIPYIMDNLDLFPKYEVELVMVCDGSPDKSYDIMVDFQKKYPDVIRICKFTKNNGQRAAINCGMKMSKGDVIGVISADLQDPFELFVQMLEYWEDGEKLVIGRRDNRAETGISVSCSKLLHSFINKYINKSYPQGGFDFFVVDRKVADVFVQSDMNNNSMQLMLLEIAGKPIEIGYERRERKAGKSGWKTRMKINQVLNIVTIYSAFPFYFLMGLGFVFLFVALLLFLWKIVQVINVGWGNDFFGIYACICFVAGVMVECNALLGIYMFKWFQNMKKNPRYIIEEDDDNVQ